MASQLLLWRNQEDAPLKLNWCQRVVSGRDPTSGFESREESWLAESELGLDFQMYQARSKPTVTCWAARNGPDGNYVRKDGQRSVEVDAVDFELAWEVYSRRRQAAALRKQV